MMVQRRSANCHPVPFDIDLTMLLKSVDSYRSNIRAAVRGLWNGYTNYFDFLDQMSLAIERCFTQAWYEGAKIYGINPSELSVEEINRLTLEVNKEVSYINGFIQSILSNSRALGGRLESLFSRADLWVSGYNRIRILASTYAAKDQKQEWVYGDAKHCRDCLTYNGKVYRASVWRKHGIYPRMYELECRGYNCKCQLVPTNKPANKGYPPRPKGKL